MTYKFFTDNGNAADYDKKAHDLLDDDNSYAVLTNDPTRSTKRAMLSLLQTLRKESQTTKDFYNKVRPSKGSSKPALFYGRVKLHKPSAPLRPLVASRGTATSHLPESYPESYDPL